MIVLEPQYLIGKGLHRECYVHPANRDLCIKIIVNGDLVEHKREQKYFKLLAKRNTPWTMLPRYHGMTESNLGKGAVFDLVRDYNGDVSKTLTYFCQSSATFEEYYSSILQALNAFRKFLIQYKIITMNLKPKNILFEKLSDDNSRLVLIDSVGNSDLIPICNFFDSLALKKINRKWKHFETLLLENYPDNKPLQQMLTNKA